MIKSWFLEISRRSETPLHNRTFWNKDKLEMAEKATGQAQAKPDDAYDDKKAVAALA